MKTKILSAAILAATLVIAVIAVINGPESIITHWDFSGNVTSHGSKYSILVLPAVAVLLFLVFLHYEKHPLSTNKLHKIKDSEHNRQLIISFIGIAEVAVMLIIMYVTLCAAEFLPMYTAVLIALLAAIIAMYVAMNRKLEKAA